MLYVLSFNQYYGDYLIDINEHDAYGKKKKKTDPADFRWILIGYQDCPMAESVAVVPGYNHSIIKFVSASSVLISSLWWNTGM